MHAGFAVEPGLGGGPIRASRRDCVEMAVTASKVQCDACGGSHGLWGEAG